MVKSNYWIVHQQACERGERCYVDPDTGYYVFTRVALAKRKKCCGCGCRHCPFAHDEVDNKVASIKQPAILHRRSLQKAFPKQVNVLFWSGGKDSFLALRAWIQEQQKKKEEDFLDSIVLLTTFDVNSRIVAHQEIQISDIQRQAIHLDITLIAVPLHPESNYLERIQTGLDVLEANSNIQSLIFGDLHLEHIKQWRDEHLKELGVPLRYPLWKTPYKDLYTDLVNSGVSCVVSACIGSKDIPSIQGISEGAVFDENFIHKVEQKDWDIFGENGEFHTLAEVWSAPVHRALGLKKIR
ncbi:MAG: DUF5522 domain-containing protein [Myxococcota bacterium]|nr:DUF5522 domain-containing protein [Myxococcota bacterium]